MTSKGILHINPSNLTEVFAMLLVDVVFCPRLISVFLMASYGFLWLSYVFPRLLINFDRPPSPDMWFHYGFPMALQCIPFVFTVFC